jgi:hypothetical protein
MRNAPLFTNIKFATENGQTSHLDERNFRMEEIIKNGGYRALLFEDNLCDGCVSAKVTPGQSRDEMSDLIATKVVVPAYSIVAAPDFFPLADSNDIRKYYHSNLDDYRPEELTEPPDQTQAQEQWQLDTNGIRNDEHFLEGGSLNLSGIRQRGNPDVFDPFTRRQAFESRFLDDKSFDTLVAVVSNVEKLEVPPPPLKFAINFRRDYSANSYLPDTGTGIFYPGWDLTYSGEKINPHFGSFGLGSPFPEDMKLCAAANGMWPVASPDAGRTFQGSLEPLPILGRPNTSIPLMDDEIGYHPRSPHVLQHGKSECFGWDGEQGPFLFIDDRDMNRPKVNFTDIGRADYVANLMDPAIGFDMSKLRTMNSRELIDRMDCIRKAVKGFDNTRVSKTSFWLISAEKVADWRVGAEALGIPNNLFGSSNTWARTSRLTGPGYLFVFALTKPKKIAQELEPNSKRRNQEIIRLAICKVVKATKERTAQLEWCNLEVGAFRLLHEIPWNS